MDTAARSGLPSNAITGKLVHWYSFSSSVCTKAQFFCFWPDSRCRNLGREFNFPMLNGKRKLRSYPLCPALKKKIELRKNLGSKTLRDLPWSLFLESVFNTHYSKQSHFYMMIVCVPEHSQSSTARQEKMKSLLRSLPPRTWPSRSSVCYGMGEGTCRLGFTLSQLRSP